MELAEARALVKDKTDKDITVRHLISVEGVMRALARRLGQDEHRWALAGLFHHLDQDQTGEDSNRHAYLAAEWLRDAGVEEPVINAVLAHTHAQHRTDLMAKAVVHADSVAGLLVGAALVRPERSAAMKVSSVKKKLKERSFAPRRCTGPRRCWACPWTSSSPWPLPASSRSHRRSGYRPGGRSPATGEVFCPDCRWRATTPQIGG
jgi:putative nucleotidyltransferase with HDIG domain